MTLYQRCRAYGLTIDSNVPLPGAPRSSAAPADLTIDFRADAEPVVDPEARHATDRHGWYSATALPGGGHAFRLAASGGTRAWSMEISCDGTRIEVRWTPSMELADVVAFVATRGVAASLAAKQVPLLHACALGRGDGAILIMGPSGAGKSTVAAAAVARGCVLLADDIAALSVCEGVLHVERGMHRIRLETETALALGWDPAQLPRVFADPLLTDKRCVELSAADRSYCDQPRRIEAIYVLGPRLPGGPRIAPLTPAEALPVLLTNTYGSDLMDRSAKAGLLSFWARVAEDVPIRRAHAPDALAGLPSLLDALEADWAPSHAASSSMPCSKATAGR